MADLYQQFQDLKRENESLKKRIEAIEERIKNINGSPIIQASVGQKLSLNSSLNVIELLRRIDNNPKYVTVEEFEAYKASL